MAVAGLRSFAASLAARAPVSVYPVPGIDARERVEDLALEPSVQLVRSPRHASVLLVAGSLPVALHEAMFRLHDQIPHPRASLWWGADPPSQLEDALELDTAKVEDRDSPVAALAALYRRTLSGGRRSERHVLPDEPPTPWRGRGDHGQGGEGMMGGKPYGRSMAMTDEDMRDGLALDAQTFRAGPFLPMLPPGLVIEVTLQGDVIQKAAVRHAPLRQRTSSGPFLAALRQPASIVQLERARASHHLRCVARFVATRGLEPLAARLLSTARGIVAGEVPSINQLMKRLERTGALRCVPNGLGRLDARAAERLQGPASRAADTAQDARSDHPAYSKLGFRPVTQADGDVRARLRQWLDEARQSLALAARAPDREDVEFADAVEGPAGVLHKSGAGSEPVELAGLLGGLEWSEAVAVLASFDVPTLRRTVIVESQ